MNAHLAARTAMAEQTIASALPGWLARARALEEVGPLEHRLAAVRAPAAIIDLAKAAVPAGSLTGSPELAGASAAVTAFVGAAAEGSILLRLIADNALLRVPLQSRILALGADVTAALVNEGEAIPMQALQWTQDSIEPFKIAAVLALTKEAWRDLSSPGQAFLNTKLREAVATAADREFFDRVLTVGTPVLTAPSTDPVAILADLRALLDAVHLRPAARLHWGVSVTAANALATLDTARADLNPMGGSFLGLPATVTSGLNGRSLVLLDGRGIAGDVTTLEITGSNGATLEMRDDPVGNSVTPTGSTLVSLFQNNLAAVRITLTLGLQPIRPAVAGVLTLEDAP